MAEDGNGYLLLTTDGVVARCSEGFVTFLL